MPSSATSPTETPSMLSRMFRVKTLDTILEHSKNQEHALKKTLSAFDLIIFGVGAMIGAGIFVLTGSAAAGAGTHLAAGPALTLSFVLTGIVCAFCAMCYSEFASMAPISGSAYTYTFSTLGEFAAWIIGWALVLEYAVGNMAVAVGWTGSVKEFLSAGFGFHMPDWMTSNTVTTVHDMSAANASILYKAIPFTIPFTKTSEILLVQKAFNLPAALIILAVTVLLVRGVSESARTAAVMVFVKTAVVLMFIAMAAYFLLGGHMDLLNTNWFGGSLHLSDPAGMAKAWSHFAPNGLQGIVTGASLIFFAYIGFDAVSTAAEETKNPQRDIPIGIIGSLLICTVLYILVTAAITGIVPLNQINKEAAVVGAMYAMGFKYASIAISVGAIAGLTSVLLVLQMGGTRIFYAIARDGLLPKFLAKVHPVYKTPHVCTILVGLFVALGAGLLPINLLAEMCNIGTLGAFLVVCLGVMVLRFTDPERKRPFKAPLGITFPILGIAGCVVVMSGLPVTTWVVTIGWFLLGMIIYFGYSLRQPAQPNKLSSTASV